MQRLEASDERRVGRFVAETAAMELGAQPFPTPFLSALRRLVPSDDVFFSELDRVREIELGQISEPAYDGPEAPVSYWEIRHEHPTCCHQEVTGDFGAHRLSEFISRRELRGSRIYADWFHPQGVEYELSVGLDAPLWHTKVFVFSRASGRGFTERDCLVLDALRPLIDERYALWLSQRRLGQVLGLVDSGGSSVVLLDGPDNVAFATEPASALLERYFGSTRGALPPAIVTWLGARPREPLEVSADHGSLVVNAVDGALLLEERPADLGLTRREREVVELVGEGLTNAQIAERLWISPGTVRRHLENAYEKLGVSTRTAAVRALSRDI